MRRFASSSRSRRPPSLATALVALVLAFAGWWLKDRFPEKPTLPRPPAGVTAAAPSVRTGAAPLAGRCTKVFDGDTYEVELPEGRRRIRVKGIDCPESAESDKAVRQAARLGVALPALLRAGQGIKDEVRELVEGRAVMVVPPGGLLQPDDYGRLLAYVEVDGRDIGAELVARGLAYARDEPHPRRTDYQLLNRRARETRRGIYEDLVH